MGPSRCPYQQTVRLWREGTALPSTAISKAPITQTRGRVVLKTGWLRGWFSSARWKELRYNLNQIAQRPSAPAIG